MGPASYLFSLADVRCENCQSKLKLKDFKVEKGFLCQSCGHAVPFECDGGLRLSIDKNLVKPSPQVQIQRRGSIFIVEKKWFSKKSRRVLLACLLFNALIAYEFWSILSATTIKDLQLEIQTLLTALTVFGIFLIFKTLQEVLNTTTVMIKNNKVVVGTSPMSFAPVRIYNVDDILHFSAWRSPKEKSEKSPKFSFGLDLCLKTGKRERLCPASDLNEAAYIEKTIEELLAIEIAMPVETPERVPV